MDGSKRIPGIAAIAGLAIAGWLLLSPRPLPPTWAGKEIGTPLGTGSACVDRSSIWSVQGSGEGTVGGRDEFFFACLPVSGEYTLTARFLGLENRETGFGSSGLMIRDSEARGAPFFHLVLSRNGLLASRRRGLNGRAVGLGHVGPRARLESSLYLRLQQGEGEIAGFYSHDGRLWWQASIDPQAWDVRDQQSLVGIPVASLANGTMATARFDRVSLEPHALSVSGLRAYGSDRTVKLEWRPVKNAIGYHVYRVSAGPAPDGWNRLTAAALIATSFRDEAADLANGTRQTYAVSAVLPGENETPDEGPFVAIAGTPIAAPQELWGCSLNEGPHTGLARCAAVSRAGQDGASEPSDILLRGSGLGLFYNHADQCYFTGRQIQGNGQATVTMVSPPATGGHLRAAGVAIRESLAAGARSVFLGMIGDAPGTGQRVVTDGPSHSAAIPPLRLPFTLRLVREGNTVVSEYSTDGGKTFRLARRTVFAPPLASAIYIGLTITSHNRRQFTTARFRDLRIETF
jgi:hypothetical protein